MAASAHAKQVQRKLLINGFLLLIVICWLIPTIGLFISSFRNRFDLQTSGWWTILPHREWRMVSEMDPKAMGLDSTKPMNLEGITATFEELRAGVDTSTGKRLQWVGNRRIGKIQVQERVWTTNTNFTLDNYRQVLQGTNVQIVRPDGTTETVRGSNFWNALFNSLATTIPATVIPILIAAFAAYGFAWMTFPGRKFLFIIVVALLVVPLQIALVPILRDFSGMGLNGTYLAIWLAHTGFGLPLAIFLLYNFMSQLPRDLFESASIDGASAFQTFIRIVLPLSIPALGAFAIFQFLWVWNDLLVALVFLGPGADVRVMPTALFNLLGAYGGAWHLLTAGAFLTMIVPLLVFLVLQRAFVRGILAGSVK